MSVVGRKKTIDSKSSFKRLSTRESLHSKKSQYSRSSISEHGSKFGRSVSKFPKQNDPSLVQTVSVINSRVVRTLINFPIQINSKLPDLTYMEATDCIREIGAFFDISDYEFNYTSFWLLDILSKLIKHMQLKGFSVKNQNTCLTWFRFVLRCISLSGDSREEIFSLLQEMFLQAEESVKAGNLVPQPEEIDILEIKTTKLASASIERLLSSKSLPSISSRQSRQKLSQKTISRSSNRTRSSKSLKSNAKSSKSLKSSAKSSKSSNNEDNVALNLQILFSLTEMIYNVFADRFMFSLISQAYSSPNIAITTEIPLDFKDPKQLRPMLVITPPESPKSKIPSASKSGKKGKGKEKGKRKGSPSPKEETEGDENIKTSKKGKSKEKDVEVKKGKGKEGKGKKKSKPSSSNHEEELTEMKKQTEGKGQEKGKKPKKKSKSIGDIKSEQVDKENTDKKITFDKEKQLIKSNSATEIVDVKIRPIEEKLKLFDKAMTPEMKLEMKKIEVKHKFILPLSEGVRKEYVENLIKSLLPPDSKPTDNTDVKEKNEGKSKKQSSLKGSKKADKKGKGKKK